MSGDLYTIGKRALACKHWTWLDGMRRDRGGRWDEFQGKFTGLAHCVNVPDVPDFSDPLTAAGVLPLVRRAWADESIGAARCADHNTKALDITIPTAATWMLLRADGRNGFAAMMSAPTEVELLVRALESAP